MKPFENYDKAVLLSDLEKACEPASSMSRTRNIRQWSAIPYETINVKGTMVQALADTDVEPLTIRPQLQGWYAIYAGIPQLANLQINLRLSSDKGHSPFGSRVYTRTVKEVFWKIADMTGEEVTVGKFNKGTKWNAALAWLRFVPLTEAEIAEFQRESARTDTRRMYLSDDMSTGWFQNEEDMYEHPLYLVESYQQSDAQWLGMEYTEYMNGLPLAESHDEQSYIYEGYRNAGKWEYRNREVYAPLIQRCHDLGIKAALTMRMGMYCWEWPMDVGFPMTQFFMNHRHLRCIDHDGHPVDTLSLAYPEVQDYFIGHFLQAASYGPDAVQMVFSRGPVFVLFEEPARKIFAERYPGVEMRTLPVEDERVLEVHCDIITGFVRRLRAALDAYCEKNGKPRIGLHARGLFSLYDSRLRGLDLYRWAEEGLISAVLNYPRRVHERLPEEVWADENHDAIDPEKYTQYVNSYNESENTAIWWRDDFEFLPPRPDGKGVLRGPASLEECMREFMEIEEKFGVPFYAEILPRSMKPAEHKRRALDLYRMGVRHLAKWDTYDVMQFRDEWSVVSRLGHREELASMTDGENVLWHSERMLRVGDIDFSRYWPIIGG